MSLSLQQLVARHVSLEWWEAVSVVQGVCAEAQRLARNGEPSIPSEQALVLTQDGRVEFAGPGRPGQPPVSTAAKLLLNLLPAGSTPAPLRLVALTAAGTTPHRTLQEFSTALEYFERPDRPGTLCSVYERADGIEAPPEEPPAPSVTEITVLPDADDALSAFESEAAWRGRSASVANEVGPRLASMATAIWPRGRTKLLAAIASAIILVAVLGVAWLSGSGSVSPPLASMALASGAILLPEVGSDRPFEERGQAAEGHDLSIRRADAERRHAHAVPPTPTPLLAVTPAATSRPRAGNAPTTARKAAVPVAVPMPPAPHALDHVDEVIYMPESDEGPRPAQERIYSVTDADVVRPVAIRPRFWYEPPADVPAATLTEIEVVVSARGSVDAARVVTGPRSYFDGMVLSAVKAWRFQPATRKGVPVSYRLRVFLTIS